MKVYWNDILIGILNLLLYVMVLIFFKLFICFLVSFGILLINEWVNKRKKKERKKFYEWDIVIE